MCSDTLTNSRVVTRRIFVFHSSPCVRTRIRTLHDLTILHLPFPFLLAHCPMVNGLLIVFLRQACESNTSRARTTNRSICHGKYCAEDSVASRTLSWLTALTSLNISVSEYMQPACTSASALTATCAVVFGY